MHNNQKTPSLDEVIASHPNPAEAQALAADMDKVLDELFGPEQTSTIPRAAQEAAEVAIQHAKAS